MPSRVRRRDARETVRIDGGTRLAVVLGYPVEHSLSPAMPQAAFRATGLNATYLPWPVPPPQLADAIRRLRAMANLLGANVTVPHKQAIIPALDALTPEAGSLGAVNTVLVRHGRLIGDNTDGAGFLTALEEDTPLVAAARRRGCRTANGLGMLLHQGALAFARWTGRPAPLDAMRRALRPPA